MIWLVMDMPLDSVAVAEQHSVVYVQAEDKILPLYIDPHVTLPWLCVMRRFK
jgi:hypothetical protein